MRSSLTGLAVERSAPRLRSDNVAGAARFGFGSHTLLSGWTGLRKVYKPLFCKLRPLRWRRTPSAQGLLDSRYNVAGGTATDGHVGRKDTRTRMVCVLNRVGVAS